MPATSQSKTNKPFVLSVRPRVSMIRFPRVSAYHGSTSKLILFLPLVFVILMCARPVCAAQTVSLADFGAIGDGVHDDAPALQAALDQLATGGGGTLIVPAGKYALLTSVARDFTGLASSVSILGVESSTPVTTTGGGYELSLGLDLVSEFYPRTGTQVAISIAGLQQLLVKDVTFIGTSNVETDAAVTLRLTDIADADIKHCEFYGVSSMTEEGAIVLATRTALRVEQS